MPAELSLVCTVTMLLGPLAFMAAFMQHGGLRRAGGAIVLASCALCWALFLDAVIRPSEPYYVARCETASRPAAVPAQLLEVASLTPSTTAPSSPPTRGESDVTTEVSLVELEGHWVGYYRLDDDRWVLLALRERPTDRDSLRRHTVEERVVAVDRVSVLGDWLVTVIADGQIVRLFDASLAHYADYWLVERPWRPDPAGAPDPATAWVRAPDGGYYVRDRAGSILYLRAGEPAREVGRGPRRAGAELGWSTSGLCEWSSDFHNRYEAQVMLEGQSVDRWDLFERRPAFVHWAVGLALLVTLGFALLLVGPLHRLSRWRSRTVRAGQLRLVDGEPEWIDASGESHLLVLPPGLRVRGHPDGTWPAVVVARPGEGTQTQSYRGSARGGPITVDMIFFGALSGAHAAARRAVLDRIGYAAPVLCFSVLLPLLIYLATELP